MFRRSATTTRPARSNTKLRFEALESREVPAVTLAGISSQAIPNDKPIYFPLTVTNTPNGDAVSYSVTATGPAGLTASIVQGGRTVVLQVSGTDKDGIAFTGTLKFRLFENAAPLATQRIIDLATSQNGADPFYVGKLFHRVLPGFVIQGGSPTGNGVGGSPLPDLPDEYNRDYTFASPGIVAMANAGDDGNDSQFFVTDPTVTLPNRPQSLNFNHTVVGILTEGFDTYAKIINTTTTTVNGENSRPVNPVTITGASVITDTVNAVLKLSPTAGYSGPAEITVTPQDADPNASAPVTFTVTGIDDGSNSRPFLNDAQLPATLTATSGSPVSFTVPFTDVDGDTVTIAVRNASDDPNTDFTTAPANLSVAIDQATGKVTLTPAAGFVGTIRFKVGVRDGALRAGSSLDAAGNFDTQVITLTVNPAPPTPPTTSPPTTSPPTTSPPTTSPPTTSPPTTSPPTTSPPTTSGPVQVSGSAAGSEPRLVILNADGSERFNILAFEPTFTGGVSVLLADVTGDGVDDAVVVPGAGGAPVVKVYDTTTGQEVFTRMVFEDTFRGGLTLATGDATGDGYDQIVVGAGVSGGPRLTLLDARTGQVLQNFFAFDQSLRGGVTASMAVLKAGPAKVQLVAVAGPGGGPQVSVYDAETLQLLGTTLVGSTDDRAGLSLRVGDPGSDGDRNLFVRPFGTSGVESELDPDTFVDFNAVAVS